MYLFKRLFLLFSISFYFSISLYAQDRAFQAGFLGGVSASQVRGDNYSGFNKIGFVGGLFVQTTTSPHFTYQFELLFSQKGSRKYPDAQNNNFEAYRIALNYVEVPILVNYKLNHFHFIAGPSLGILISSKEEDYFSEITNNPPFRKYELSLNAGAEWEFSEKIYIEARYNFSILPIRTGSQGFTIWYDGGAQYNHVLLLMGRYLF